MPINPILLQEVKRAMASKAAFVAAGGGAPPMDPAMAAGGGGAPPMDPSMMGAAPGGAPPMDPSMMGAAGGAPPMDPSMMAAAGGAPPMDPAMMGAAPPPPPAPAASPDDIRALIQEEIKKVTGGGEGGAKKSKGAGKVDPGQMLEYMDRQQKLLINLYESLGLNLPYNILDKPKPEGEGGEEEKAPAKEQGTDANASGIPPIKPIEPMGGDKQASILEKAQAARYLLNAMNRKGR